LRGDNGKSIVGLVEICKLNGEEEFKERWVVKSHEEFEGQAIKGNIMGLREEYKAKIERVLIKS